MRVLEWEIKVSKLCNLRCQYCYEFPDLGNPQRISLAGWRSILTSARWYHEEIARRRPDEPVATRFVWHGGEPLLLPLRYYREVLALQREILGPPRRRLLYGNSVPTNLYAVPPDTLAFLKEEAFQLTISFDAVSGLRVTRGGKATEERVAANLRRLLEDGWDLGCNTVLAAHNAGQPMQVYERVRELARGAAGSLFLNVIPLHGTPTDDGSQAFSLLPEQIIASLTTLFEQWIADPEPLPLLPLLTYYAAVLRKMTSLPRQYFDRRRYGESSLVVNTDGQLYLFGEAYQAGRALGCLFEQSFEEILRSEAYQASLEREEALAARYCRGCPYDGYCNHDPLINGRRDEPGERCSVGFPLHRRIEEWLLARGYTARTLQPLPADLPHLAMVAG